MKSLNSLIEVKTTNVPDWMGILKYDIKVHYAQIIQFKLCPGDLNHSLAFKLLVTYE